MDDMYAGTPLSKMSREELMDAVRHLGRSLQDSHREHIRQLNNLTGHRGKMVVRGRPEDFRQKFRVRGRDV